MIVIGCTYFEVKSGLPVGSVLIVYFGGVMYFTFVAPFRTKINFNSIGLAENPSQLASTIARVMDFYCSDPTPGVDIKSIWFQPESGQLHYASLNEDFLPSTVLPIYELNFKSCFVDENINAHHLPALLDVSSVGGCRVEYFDNTIAVLYVDVMFSESQSEADVFSALDKWSTDFCARLIDMVGPIEDKIFSLLVDCDHRSGKRISLAQSEFNVFFDFKDEDLLVDGLGKMLWVTRVCHVPIDYEKAEILEKWTQKLSINSLREGVAGVKVFLSVGNNVIWGDLAGRDRVALFRSLSVALYFYVIYSVVNRNLRYLYIGVSNDKKNKINHFKKINQIRGYVDYIQGEMADVLMGLQGERKFLFVRFLDVWQFDFLKNSVNERKQSLSEQGDAFFREKQSRYARIVETILSAIGGVAILDFFVNLYWFSSEDEASEDRVVGLVDFASWAPLDVTLYVVIALLSIVLFLVLKKR